MPVAPPTYWTQDPAGIRLAFDIRAVEPDAAAAARWLDGWRDVGGWDDSSERIDVCIPWTDWVDSGLPPPPATDAELVDVFQGRHAGLCRLIGVGEQRIGVETVGYIGGAQLTFAFLVDGDRVPVAGHGFPTDATGRPRPLGPSAYAAYDRVRAWNARGQTTRAQQIRFLAELRDLLDRAVALHASTRSPLVVDLDPHLQPFRAHRVSEAALSWKADARGNVFDLEVSEKLDDGTTRSIDLRRLDPDSPMVALSTHEHLLLDDDVHAVARVAQKQRNRLRKHVERHLQSPATLIPEGVSLEHVDLSAYSPRVVGFAPIVRAERACDIQSSGVEWYRRDDERTAAAPFLRLLIAQPGAAGIETLTFSTPEEARDALVRLEGALATGSAEPVEIGGKRVAPTTPLKEQLARDLERYDTRMAKAEGEASGGEEPRTGRVAAVIAESTDAVAVTESSEGTSPVPWHRLSDLLAPGYQLKPHQRDAVAWMWRHHRRGLPGVLLADDMGLGKTFQVAAFLALLATPGDAAPRRPSLIVCPVILLDTWQDELRKFFRPHVFESLLVLYDT